jgi:hypothetical protein
MALLSLLLARKRVLIFMTKRRREDKICLELVEEVVNSPFLFEIFL